MALAEPITLAVGATVTVNVGIARGVGCDDPSIVTATSSSDQSGEANIVTLRGLAEGSTTCRAGNVAFGAVRVLEVTVVKPNPKPKQPEPPPDPERRPE